MMRGCLIAALCALGWLGAVDHVPAMAQAPSETDRTSCDYPPVEDGRLRCLFADGRRFDGVVSSGKANGQGLMSFPNGDRFSGQFVNGLFGGRGTYWYGSGARYDGDFANGVRHGQGTTVWPGGSRYTGSYRNNRPDGYGTVTTSSGTHSGTWTNGCLATARMAIDNTVAGCGFQ